MAEVTHLQIASIWIDISVREQHNNSAEATKYPVEEGADITDHVRLMPNQIVMEGEVTNQPFELPGSHVEGVRADESGFAFDVTEARATGVTSKTIQGEPTLGLLGLLPGVDQGATLLRTVGVDARSNVQLNMVLPQLATSSRKLQANALRFSKPFDRVKAVDQALQVAFRSRRPVQVITGLRVYEAVVIIDLSVMREASNAGRLHFGCTAEVIRITKSSGSLVGAPDPVHPRGRPQVNKGNQNTAPVLSGEIPGGAAARVSALEQAIRALGGG